MTERYTVVEFRGRPFYLDPVAFSPRPVGFCAGRVVEKGLECIARSGKERLAVLDFCCGPGSVGLCLFDEAPGRIERMGYVDVNYFNLLALEHTLHTLRDYPEEDRQRHVIMLSNVLRCVPPEEQYDLILSNPPHRDQGDGHALTGEYSLKNLYLVDPGWRMHAEFYATAHTRLLPGGECWFIEWIGSPRGTFAEMIRANAALEYLGDYDQEPLGDEVPRYYWMGCRRRAEANRGA